MSTKIILACVEGDSNAEVAGSWAEILSTVGNWPERAVVLCVDESQTQAIDHSQPVLPTMPGMTERCIPDYRRNGGC